jgi:hypothetical protein
MMTSVLGGIFSVGISIIGLLTIIAPSAAPSAAKRFAIPFAVLLGANFLMAGTGHGIWRMIAVLAGLAASIGAVFYLFDPARGAAVLKKTAGFVLALFILWASVEMLWSSALGRVLLLAAACAALIGLLRPERHHD